MKLTTFDLKMASEDLVHNIDCQVTDKLLGSDYHPLTIILFNKLTPEIH